MRDLRALATCRGLALALAGALLGACHSGGGGNGDVNIVPSSSSGTQSGPAPVYLSGTVAAGLPLVGATVVVKDANSTVRASDPTDTFGSYQVNTYGLTGPLVVEARGSIAGRALVMHSYSPNVPAGGSVLNVTPLTDAALALVTGRDPQSYFAGGVTGVDFSLLTAPSADLNAVSKAITGQAVATSSGGAVQVQNGILANVLTALGVTAVPNIFTDTLTPDRAGLDAVSDLVDVNVLPQTGTSAAPQEQVQFTSRINESASTPPAQVVVNGSPGQALATTPELAMSGGDVAQFDLPGLSYLTQGSLNVTGNTFVNGFNQLLGATGQSNNSLQSLFFDSTYLDGGKSATADANMLDFGPTDGGGNGNAFRQGTLSAPLVESCTTAQSSSSGASTPASCQVRVGYTLTHATYSGQYGFFYDTVRAGPPDATSGEESGLGWFMRGNQQYYRINAHYRFFNPVFPGVTAASQGNITPELELRADFSGVAGSPAVSSVSLATVDSGGTVTALPNPTVRTLATASAVAAIAVLPTAVVSTINANLGHIRVTVSLSDSSLAVQDIFLPQVSASPPLAYFPSLPNAVTEAYGYWNWENGAFQGAVGNPGILPANGRDDIPVLALEAQVDGSSGSYDNVQGDILWAPALSDGVVAPLGALKLPYTFGAPAVSPLPAPYDSSALDRRLLVYAVDWEDSAYVTGYCYGSASCN